MITKSTVLFCCGDNTAEMMMTGTHIIADRAERIMMDAMVESSRSTLHNLVDMIMMEEDGRVCYYLQHQQRRS